MTLADVREQIDRLDDQLVGLLAQRQQQVQRAARFKGDEAAVRAPDRRASMMARLRERALEEDLDPSVVDAVWAAMINAFIALELREHRSL